MGYARNQLATLVTGVFAAVLTLLWFVMVPVFPLLEFIFIMAVPITWFLVVMCWLAQKSVDYAHSHSHTEKKSLSSTDSRTAQVYTSDGKLATENEIKEAKTELSDDLNQLKDNLKLKDSEIERLKQEIANLQTLVQIESLKAELANLKMLASKEKSSRK